MAGEQMILSGDQIAFYASSSTSWPPPDYQTRLEFQGIAPLGNDDSRFILIRTQGDGDVIANGNLFTIYTAVDNGSGLLVPGVAVTSSNFVTPDGYGGLGAGDNYLAFGMFGGERILVKLDGFNGATDFVVRPGGDVEPGGDGEISISEIEAAQPGVPPICFASGTMIRTAQGETVVQDLAVGDLVQTLDNGPQPIRWIGAQILDARALALHPEFAPIRVKAGALGQGVPVTDLVVSPQHRILIRSKLATRMFGAAELLVAAKHLLEIDGVEQIRPAEGVTYFHILFDRHEIIFSNGAETESLFTGPEALKSLGPRARDELFGIFPELAQRDGAHPPHQARVFAPAGKSRQMALRHSRNHLSLVEQTARAEGLS